MTVVDFSGMRRITKGKIKSGNYSERFISKGTKVPKGWSNRGWVGESTRHSMASYGIKTGRKKVNGVTAKQLSDAKTYFQKHLAKKREVKAPITQRFNVWDVEDPESAGMTSEDYLEMFQHLEDTGQAYSLQGWYGRTAMGLIANGQIKPNPKYHSKEELADYKKRMEFNIAFG